MSTEQILTALRRKVAASRKKLEEQEKAIQVLEEMLSSETGQHDDLTPNNKARVFGLFDKFPDQIQAKSLTDEVKEILPVFGENEFTVPMIEAELAMKGVKIKGKYPRAQIAVTMKTLENKHFVIRTYRGTGSTPHRFILSHQSN